MRISPNELYFGSVESWRAIYGHRTNNAPVAIKSEFYDIFGAGFESLCIGSERDPHKHGKMRKMLSAAFATKALNEQEDIIANAVDEFVDCVGKKGSTEKSINMTKWFEMVAFDTLGEIVFEEEHPNGPSKGAREEIFKPELVAYYLCFSSVLIAICKIEAMDCDNTSGMIQLHLTATATIKHTLALPRGVAVHPWRCRR